MRSWSCVAAGLAAAVGLFGPAHAQAPSAEETCTPYDAAYARAPLMRVTSIPGGRLYLQDKAQVCPAKGGCAWRRKGFLAVGDVVLASAPRASFRCVYYGSASGKLITGFVPVSSLQPMPDPAGLDPTFLVGRWKEDGGDTITISKTGQALRAAGKARNGDNSGQFSGMVQPTREGLTIKDGDCQIAARRRGPYLAVSDNNACGGMNVSFGGIYVKVR